MNPRKLGPLLAAAAFAAGLWGCFEPPLRRRAVHQPARAARAGVASPVGRLPRRGAPRVGPHRDVRGRAGRGAALQGEPLAVSLTRSTGETQLEIYPGKGGRANLSEGAEVARALDRFSDAAARYERALADLWAYLDELSRKAYDPFRAPVSVEVKGTVLESTGFLPDDQGRYRIPSVSLSGALARLSSRWVTPDPLSELARRVERLEDDPPDVDAFLAPGRRVFARPDASEVRAALEASLAPAPVYRLRWKTAPKS